MTLKNRLVGIVLGVSRKGTCHLLPAQAISFLAAHPEAKRVRLGCLLDINASTPVIEGLINGGPLARGGIQTGDILISINGTTINNYGDMLDATYYLTGEKPLTVEVIRGTQVVKSRGIIPRRTPVNPEPRLPRECRGSERSFSKSARALFSGLN